MTLQTQNSEPVCTREAVNPLAMASAVPADPGRGER